MMSFSSYICKYRELGQLIVQPRMGFGQLQQMSDGLLAVYHAKSPTIGTITLDSYTRVNQYMRAKQALENDEDLNGFPIVTHGEQKTKMMLNSLPTENDFTIQVRHGTALPRDIFKSIISSGIDATEGGPISYCLPYSRVPINDAIENWKESCCLFASSRQQGFEPHIESFAGCMLGQLCPPSLLIALGILECLFFKRYGIQSVSLSYAQCINPIQDVTALAVLRKLGAQYLSDLDWHTVMYSYMGLFPTSLFGSVNLIADSARIAKIAQCERLIVKTPLESYRIPSIEENVASLEMAYTASNEVDMNHIAIDEEEYHLIYAEVEQIIEAVLNINLDVSKSLLKAFAIGILDVPYCLHAENKQKTSCYIDDRSFLKWASIGNLPIKTQKKRHQGSKVKVTSGLLLDMLKTMRHQYDSQFYR